MHKKRGLLLRKPLFLWVKLNYGLTSVVEVSTLTVVSWTVESVIVVSVAVVSVMIAEESVIVVSDPEPEPSELQAATDKEIAKAKKPNLNKFFISILF